MSEVLTRSEALLYQKTQDAAARDHAAIDRQVMDVLITIAADHNMKPGEFRIGPENGQLVIEPCGPLSQ